MRQNLFSEFSYGFAVVAEFVRDPGLQIVEPPEFPSTRKEGEVAFDVRLNAPALITYLQFKLSDYMYGRTAGERGLFAGGPYYRFHLRNAFTSGNKTQHEVLVNLERPGNAVYYIAPAFYSGEDWRNFYRQGKVVLNSILFSPKELGPVDHSTGHVVAFEKADSEYGWLCSEALERSALPGHRFFEHLKSAAIEAPRLTTERLELELRLLTETLGASTLRVSSDLRLGEQGSSDAKTHLPEVLLRQIASIARSHLNCSVMVVYG